MMYSDYNYIKNVVGYKPVQLYPLLKVTNIEERKLPSMQTEKQFICLTLSGQFWTFLRFGNAKQLPTSLMAATHICHIVLTRGADYEQTLRMIKEHCAEKLDADHQPVWLRLYDEALFGKTASGNNGMCPNFRFWH